MHFSRIVKRMKRERSQLRLLVLGLDNAGKTTVLHSLLGRPVEMVRPTFGYQIYDAAYKSVGLVILDVGGQSMFVEYWSSYYEDVDGVVFVVDSSDSRSFVEHIGRVRSALAGVPMLILANKSDLNPVFDAAQLGGDFCEFVARDDVKLAKCCGITGEGLEEGFEWVLDRSAKRLAWMAESERPRTADVPGG